MQDIINHQNIEVEFNQIIQSIKISNIDADFDHHMLSKYRKNRYHYQ